MLKRLFLIVGVLLFGYMMGLPLSSVEAGGKAGKLEGEVMALNTKDAPQIMVMRVVTKSGAEMVVGALVNDATKIEKKGQAVALGQLVEGDKVILTYERTKEGALAKTITIP